MSSTPIVLSGISRTALLQLLELAGDGARVDIELPPSLSSLKQARIHATLDISDTDLASWLQAEFAPEGHRPSNSIKEPDLGVLSSIDAQGFDQEKFPSAVAAPTGSAAAGVLPNAAPPPYRTSVTCRSPRPTAHRSPDHVSHLVYGAPPSAEAVWLSTVLSDRPAAAFPLLLPVPLGTQSCRSSVELQLEVVRHAAVQYNRSFALTPASKRLLAKLCLVSKTWLTEGQRLLYNHFDGLWERRQLFLGDPHLGLLVESANFNWWPSWPELLTWLPMQNLRHVDQLGLSSIVWLKSLDEHIRPTLLSLVTAFPGFNHAYYYFDLRFLHCLGVHYGEITAIGLRYTLGPDPISTLEKISLVHEGRSCSEWCSSAQDCPQPQSQHKAIDVLCSCVRSNLNRYPALRRVEVANEFESLSFATPAGRHRVRLGAIAPKARALGLTLVDPDGLPWLEEYDAE